MSGHALVKLCECGTCGLPAPIAKETNSRNGHVQGQPVRFIKGHNNRVRYGPWVDRYWSQVDKNGPIVRPELGPCWLWTGYRDPDGYGRIMVNGHRRPAHQIALELVGFIIPAKGLEGLHRCDHTSCVRPDHLKIDTKPANVADKVAKGRQTRGEHHGYAKLRQADVDEIRRLGATGGISKAAIGQRFGVGKSQIGRILSGEAWREQ
jgi:hypothetical protein